MIMANPPADRRALGRALADLRNAAGLSTYQLAERLGWSQSAVSRVENARVLADPADVRRWAEAAGAPPDVAEQLVSDAEDLGTLTRSYRRAHAGGMAKRQVDITEAIASGKLYRAYGLAEVPGMLQTSRYATHILELADIAGTGGIPQAVARRMDRQDLLYDSSRSFQFVLAEWALNYRAGDDDLMAGQAAKIIEIATRPNVSVTVIPSGTHPGADALSGFVIYDPPGGRWVLVELLTGETEIRVASEVAFYETTFDQLKDAGVTGDEAAAVIRRAMIR
jgi:transcriptional regulator with XRE-family HTH domain